MLLTLNTLEIRSKLQELDIPLLSYQLDTDRYLLIKQDANNLFYYLALHNNVDNQVPIEDTETLDSFFLLLSLGLSFQDAKKSLEIK